MSRRTRLLTALAAALACLPAGAPAGADSAAPPADDPAFRAALDGELARTMSDLRLGSEPRPYFVAYQVADRDQAVASASFGAVTGSDRQRQRLLRVDVRVGDRKLDNTNFADGGLVGPFSGSASVLPLDDDPVALRRDLWIQTDRAYKRALDQLSRKRAAEKSRARSEDDPAADFSEVTPARTVHVAPGAEARIDPAALAATVARLSAVFRDYPTLQESRVAGSQLAVRTRYLSSEGAFSDERRAFLRIDVTAETQAPDGMRLNSYVPFTATTLEGLPPIAEMEKAVRRMAEELGAQRTAAVPESGGAVVIFEGRAAAQLVRRILAENLSGTPHPRSGGSGRRAASELGPGDLAAKLRRRIAVPFLSAWDDPLAETGPGGIPLFGAYRADDEGVPAERVSLVEGGVLKSLLMSRTPRKEITRSNGHGRGGPQAGAVRGRFANLFVGAGKAGLASAALRAKALDEARSLGAETPVYAVRGLDGSLRPLVMVRLREDGKEEPVRGLSLVGLEPRSLKDVIAAGKEPFVYNTLESGGGSPVGFVPTSVITPALVLTDVDVRRDRGGNTRPPHYPHPYF